MYPDLSYILHAIFGSAPDNAFSIVKTFGLFLIISFLVSAYFLRLELIRKEKQGLLKGKKEKVVIGRPARWQELATNGLLGFILGFKLPYIAQNFPEFQADTAGVLLSTKGYVFWGVVGAGLLAFLKFWEHHRKALPKPQIKTVEVLPHQRIGDITILAAVAGIVGAKLFAVIESTENFRSFLRDPIHQLLSGSGLAIYGGLILAFIAVFWFVRSKGMNPIHVMDAVAPALIMGYAVGRIGCQLSGDGDWGIENPAPAPDWWFLPDWLWSYDYPHNVLNDGVRIADCEFLYCSRLDPGVFPTPVYETTLALLIFAVLWVLRKRIVIPGLLFFIYMVLNGIERWWIEKIRVNPDIEILGMQATQAEYIAALLVIGGMAGGVWSYLKWKKALPD